MGKETATTGPRVRKRGLIPLLGLFLAALCAFALLYSAFASVLLDRQWHALYEAKVRIGTVAVEHFANNAPPLLLDDDTLGLNVLLKQTRSIPSLVYAYIFDSQGTVKAHTDSLKIGTAVQPVPSPQDRRAEGDAVYERYTVAGGGAVLSISRPVLFLGEKIAHVRVGLSLDRIYADLARERAAALKTLTTGGVLVALLGTIVFMLSVYLARRSSVGTAPKSPMEWNDREFAMPDDAAAAEAQEEKESPENGTASSSSDEARRNQVSVLFVGIKGFKGYAQKREPAVLFDDLNEYLSLATTSVREHGGFVERFVGDGVISVFESSDAGLDHAERALSAALSMRTVFRERGAAGNQLLPKAGFGISSGVVLSGWVASEDGRESTFLGEIFKSAYSLTVVADPGEIILSRDSYLQLQNSISVEPLPPREIMHRFHSWENFRFMKKNGI